MTITSRQQMFWRVMSVKVIYCALLYIFVLYMLLNLLIETKYSYTLFDESCQAFKSSIWLEPMNLMALLLIINVCLIVNNTRISYKYRNLFHRHRRIENPVFLYLITYPLTLSSIWLLVSLLLLDIILDICLFTLLHGFVTALYIVCVLILLIDISYSYDTGESLCVTASNTATAMLTFISQLALIRLNSALSLYTAFNEFLYKLGFNTTNYCNVTGDTSMYTYKTVNNFTDLSILIYSICTLPILGQRVVKQLQTMRTLLDQPIQEDDSLPVYRESVVAPVWSIDSSISSYSRVTDVRNLLILATNMFAALAYMGLRLLIEIYNAEFLQLIDQFIKLAAILIAIVEFRYCNRKGERGGSILHSVLVYFCAGLRLSSQSIEVLLYIVWDSGQPPVSWMWSVIKVTDIASWLGFLILLLLLVDNKFKFRPKSPLCRWINPILLLSARSVAQLFSKRFYYSINLSHSNCFILNVINKRGSSMELATFVLTHALTFVYFGMVLVDQSTHNFH